ncbi:hypothetical protein E2C01_052764 [Portunus trituberculatus]|uniref:Uncharacterized protein n=1 Tax=Portunus trituberculatus TaxID=210409 RepID=A0A5B7GMR1_PORTR|nr:hypothetical protein [Portunus trituberculatus]
MHKPGQKPHQKRCRSRAGLSGERERDGQPSLGTVVVTAAAAVAVVAMGAAGMAGESIFQGSEDQGGIYC